MLNEIRGLAKGNTNFVQSRWENALSNEHFTEVQGRIWPTSDEFFHPLNPMYSIFLPSVGQINYFKVILLRDGAQMLLDFFLRFPLPKLTQTKLIVPADLLFLVPEVWHPHVFCYRLKALRPMVHQKNYFFYGLANEVFLNWRFFKHQFPAWLEQFDAAAPVQIYLANRGELYNHAWPDNNIAFEICAAFQRHFKQQLSFLKWAEVGNLSADAQRTFVSLDQFRGAAHWCTIESNMLAKCINVWPRGEYAGFQGEEIGSWPVSFQHSLHLYTAKAQHSDFSKFFFIKKMSNAPGVPLPTPIVPELMSLLPQRLTLQGLVPATAQSKTKA